MSDSTIAVKGLGPEGKVVLWERDGAHPGGEVFVKAGKVSIVARTPRVEKALRSGQLEQVEKPATVAKKGAAGKKGQKPTGAQESPPADGAGSAPAEVVNPTVKVVGAEES